MLDSLLPRRLRLRGMDNQDSMALLSRGSSDDEDDGASVRTVDIPTIIIDDASSVNETLVGDSPLSARLADFDDEKVFPRGLSGMEKLAKALGSLSFLLPSFLIPDDKPPAKLHPSAWLDGLRGVAAFLVVWHHSSLLYFSWTVHDGWHSSDSPGHSLLIQLPLIRLLIAGAPQVKIFFAISGYALSHKPLKLARAGRHSAWASALSSSVFRRHPRLFLPAVLILFVGMLAGWLRLFGSPVEGVPDWNAGVAIPTRAPPFRESFSEQVADWWTAVLRITNPLATDLRRGATPYDWNLWTLPMELDCSFVVFLSLAAFAWLRSGARLVMTACVAAFALWYTHWAPFLFVSGMFICDLHFELERKPEGLLPAAAGRELRHRVGIRGVVDNIKDLIRDVPNHIPQPLNSAITRVARSNLWPTFINLTSFVTALWLLSTPENNRGGKTSPFYTILTNNVPANYGSDDENHWWLSIGAVLLVFTVDRAPFLQRVFVSPFAQYLGRISYALYLVHGPLVFSLGWHLGRKCTELTGRATDAQYGAGIALAYALLWPVLVWTADLAARGVDVKSVEFSKWAYDKMVRWEE